MSVEVTLTGSKSVQRSFTISKSSRGPYTLIVENFYGSVKVLSQFLQGYSQIMRLQRVYEGYFYTVL